MSLELCVLASGSSGNCAAVRTPAGTLLIDFGIGPRQVAQRLGSEIDLAGVCLTHLDSDHFNTAWLPTLSRRRIPIFCHRDRVADVREATVRKMCSVEIVPFYGEAFEPIAGISMSPISLRHDAEGSHGFLIDGHGGRIGYATDLGKVPDELIERFVDLDVLAIESNYDQQMQIDSPRPWFLKQRIMGGRGHLSNAQALSAVRQILTRHESRAARLPAHIVLLHRSREANCPVRLRNLFSRDVRIAPRLVLAEQQTATPWLRADRIKPLVGEQLSLAFG
jgi:phosphoribosyl 1,2-cyclic phosphodiesterase